LEDKKENEWDNYSQQILDDYRNQYIETFTKENTAKVKHKV
jgi:hypothetical protein